MAPTKVEFEARNYSNQRATEIADELATIEEADKFCKHHNQCTWEETQTAQAYSHIIEYRDDEHYNDLYFI